MSKNSHSTRAARRSTPRPAARPNGTPTPANPFRELFDQTGRPMQDEFWTAFNRGPQEGDDPAGLWCGRLRELRDRCMKAGGLVGWCAELQPAVDGLAAPEGACYQLARLLFGPPDSSPGRTGENDPRDARLLEQFGALMAARRRVEALAIRAEAATPPPPASRRTFDQLSDTDKAIVRMLRRKTMKATAIADGLALGHSHQYIRQPLARLVREGYLTKVDDGYKAAPGC